MLARLRHLSTLLLVLAVAGAAPACSDRVTIGGGSVDERWVTTENTNVAIDWDKVAEAYKLAEGPADFERRVNELYGGDEIVSIAVRDDGDRSQVITGFIDRNGDGRVSDPMIDAVLSAPAAPPVAPVAAAGSAAAAQAEVPAVVATAPASPAAPAAPAAAAVAPAAAPAVAAAAVPAVAPAAVPAVAPAAAPAVAPAVAALPPASGTEREAIFTIRRTVGADGSAQVQTTGYGMYAGYHSPVMSIMSGMLMGAMLSNMFMPSYMPMAAYATSPARAGELRSQRSSYRAANPSRFAKPSKTGRSYGGTPGGTKSGGAPARSRGGSRFGIARPVTRLAHLAG